MASRIVRVLLVCLVVATGTAPAEEPWLEAPLRADSGAVLRASAEKLPGETEENSAWYRLLLDESRWTFESDGRYSMTRRRVLRILSHEGAEGMGSVAASWKPWSEERPILRARVIRKDGTVLVLDEKTIAESPASSDPLLFDDRKVLRAPLPGMEPGAVVEWEVVKTRTSAPPSGALGSQLFAYSYPAGRIRFRVEAPSTLPFFWKASGLDLAPKVSLAAGRVVRIWERTSVPPLEDVESDLPPEVPVNPLVEFATGTSWRDVATRYRAVVEERLDAGPLSAGALPPGPFTSRLHEAAALAEWVRREVRYTGLLFGDGAIVPSPPAGVLQRKFGDCKDQATLLVAALRARGFDAAVALLRVGEDPDVTSALPSLEAFDHAIVHVAGLRADGIFVDTTSRFERFGEVPVRLQGRLALVCRPETNGLTRIPVAPAAANTSRTEVLVTVPEAGPTKVTEKTVWAGAFESSRRQAFDGLSEADLKATFDRWTTASFGGGKVLRGVASPARDLSGPFTLELEVEQPGFVRADDERAVVALAADGFLSELPDPEEGERKNELTAVPFRQEFRYRFIPPQGFAPLLLPEEESRSLGPATFHRKAAAREDGSADFEATVELTRARLTPAEVTALREGLAALRGSEPMSFVFEHRSAVAAARGDLEGGLKILREEVRRDPSKAAPHRRLARLFLTSGMGDAARREAREAVRKEPGSARAWYQLGLVLEQDAWGRLRRKGWDPVQAEAALRKSLELDPDNLEVWFELAILLEHDREGFRYADPARLALALGEYGKLVEKAPSATVVARNYAFALLRADRPADAAAFLEKRSDADQMHGLRVAAVAASRGTARALELLRQANPDLAARRKAAGEVGALLLVLRRYPEGAALLEEAARGGDGAASVAVPVETARRLKKRDGPVPAPVAGDALSAVNALMAAVFAPDGGVDAAEKLYVKAVRTARDADGAALLRKFLEEEVRGIRRSALASGASLAFLRDSALAAGLTADGTAAEGWLVSGTVPVAGQAPRQIRVWVGEEDGVPRIVSDDGGSRFLCWYALDLVTRGRTEEARRWLERAALEVEIHEEEGDLLLDPLLPRLRPGAGAPAAELRLAALAGLAGSPLPEPLLDELRRAQREKPDDPLRAALLHRSLVARTGADSKRTKEEVRAILEEAIGLLPIIRVDRASGETAAMFDIGLKGRAGRVDAALAAAEEHARSHASCRLVGSSLVSLRSTAGDMAGALEAADRLMQRPSPSAGDANTSAWARYVAGKVDEKALGQARQAVEGSRRSNPAILNTLAAICAELGRHEEAHSLVLRSMELLGLDEPMPGDWLVVGRIRESFGLADEAIEAYGRASKDEEDQASFPDSVGEIAARRARALRASKAGAD
ncbi:MAG: DUF3857 domain-containing protein [Thermoanaerobaculia bacterium]